MIGAKKTYIRFRISRISITKSTSHRSQNPNRFVRNETTSKRAQKGRIRAFQIFRGINQAEFHFLPSRKSNFLNVYRLDNKWTTFSPKKSVLNAPLDRICNLRPLFNLRTISPRAIGRLFRNLLRLRFWILIEVGIFSHPHWKNGSAFVLRWKFRLQYVFFMMLIVIRGK